MNELSERLTYPEIGELYYNERLNRYMLILLARDDFWQFEDGLREIFIIEDNGTTRWRDFKVGIPGWNKVEL